jgi:hypothetical protein
VGFLATVALARFVERRVTRRDEGDLEDVQPSEKEGGAR